ncbi:hypothetical protein B0H16DRAFT_1608318 [Mycena metata]|uniref:HNH nuclease domain-containing protein n=1 Tax=Mycena metata TaxID=1033252 RepID=A0AAD7HEE3_9AGAR|nr:hypothetical protein B0H16DRAFT_1608318 [Mycena metata]
MTSAAELEDGLISSPPLHGHFLSDKSAALQRDTFVFWADSYHPITLLFGFNQKLTPVSSAKLHRWVDVMSGRHQEFILGPVKVTPRGIMSYVASPDGPLIDPGSEEPLPPGNYAWYSDRNLTIPHTFFYLAAVQSSMRRDSFEYRVLEMGDDERLCSLYKFPFGVEQAVHQRDAQQCRITGSTDKTMQTWIVPPPWAWAAVMSYDADSFDPTPFIVAANVITLRTDLKVHFYNHNFAVDADDNYRIVVFRDMGDVQSLLPTHLPRRSHDDPADAEFFRLHLRCTLNFMLLDGDISEKYPPHVILNMMEQLGVRGYDCEMVSLEDKRWQTDLGRAILADELQARADRSIYESQLGDSDSNSDSDSDSEPQELNCQPDGLEVNWDYYK